MKNILTIFIVILAGITAYYFIFHYNYSQPKTNVAIQKSATDTEKQISQIEKTLYSKRGTIVNMYGDPIQESLELYLNPIPDTGADMEIDKLTFKTGVNGGFEFIVEELGAYNLSFQEGWYSEQLDKINPVDFRYAGGGYRIIVRNEEYDEKIQQENYIAIKTGDTLWTISLDQYGSGRYWPLLARDNRLDQSEGIPDIFPGDQLFLPKLTNLTQDDLYYLRESFHAGNFQEDVKITNEEFSYSISYPGHWIAEPATNVNYDGLIHKQRLTGPNYRKDISSNKLVGSFLTVTIYENDSNMSLEEFVLDKGLTDETIMEIGHFTTEERNGGILIVGGYYNNQHLMFFEDNLVYNLTFSDLFNLEKVDPLLHLEVNEIIDSFILTNNIYFK